MKTLTLTSILGLAILAGCSTSAPRVASTDYDGKWVGVIECGPRSSGNAPTYISRRIELLVVNGQGKSLPDPVWQDWLIEFNGTQVQAQARVSDPRGQWAYQFDGSVAKARKFVLNGHVYDGWNRDRVGRSCSLTGVLAQPAATSLASRTK